MSKSFIVLLKTHKLRGQITAAYAVTLYVLWSALVSVFSPTVQPHRLFSNDNQQPAQLSSHHAVSLDGLSAIAQGEPKEIEIPSVGLHKTVQPGEYDRKHKTWTLSDDGVHYANESPMPNELFGATLLYAHNNKYAFGKLTHLPDDAKVFVRTSNGYEFVYSFVHQQSHTPNDVGIFSYRGDPLLVLQTCGGSWNEVRDLYTFQLDSVRKIT